MIHPRLYEKLSTGNADTEPFPVILYYCKPRAEVRRCITHRYGPIKYELPFIRAVALDLPADKLKLIVKEPMVQWITDDITVSKVGEGDLLSSPDRSDPRFDSALWPILRDDNPRRSRKPRYVDSRRPVAVAVIDTGVAPHPDLLQPVNRIRAFYDLIGYRSYPYDDDGHGTHIAGILCGLSSRPAVSGEHHIPPWSPDLVVVKALNGQGNGNASDILAAMQWILNNSRYYNIRVVNLSLGVTADDDYDSDPLVRGVEALTRHGICVVTAAGNSGPKPNTISSPGICRSAITVGAADGDHVASFSSRGPTPQGLIKPDLVAPGVNILSLDAEAVPITTAADPWGGEGDRPEHFFRERTAAGRGVPCNPYAEINRHRIGDPPGYVSQSGTSMAAPLVSRAAAEICQILPGVSPWVVKQLLLQNTIPLDGEPPEAQGRGILID